MFEKHALFLVIHNLLRYHVFMKKCPICGRKVVSKRKDAIYCRNPRCRKAAYSAAEQGTAPLSVPARPESAAGQSPGTRRWPGPKISPVPEARSAEGTAGLPPPPARQA